MAAKIRLSSPAYADKRVKFGHAVVIFGPDGVADSIVQRGGEDCSEPIDTETARIACAYQGIVEQLRAKPKDADKC